MPELNKQQREAVEHKDGPILVIAGAGTGKTRVITERIAHIIDEKWCKNDEILGLTFTEKAAAEMEERLDMLMPLGYEAVQISTFHSFCEKLLRQYGIDIGIPTNFKIIEGVNLWKFIKEHLYDFELDYYRPLGNPTKFIDSLVSHFSRVKEEMRSPEDYIRFAENSKLEARNSKSDDKLMESKRLLEIANAYKKYQELLMASNYLDFSDLQYKAIEILEKRPNILAYLQQHYKYILVDEYQDTNIAQNNIVDRLAEKHRNIMAVGDDDQSIYKFRGAAISNIIQFEKKYPGLKKVVLVENYRSNQKILDFAYASIQHNNPDRLEVKSKVDKKIKAQRPGENDSVRLVHCSTIEQELEYVINEIKKSEGVSLNEIAILCRTNAYAKPFTEALKKENIPYQFLSERGLYNKEEVKDLIAVLRVIANPTDDISFYRVLRMEIWNIPMETIAELLAQSKKMNSNVWSFIKKSDECKKLTEVISDLIDFSKNHTVGETLFRFTERVNLYDILLKKGTIEAEEKISNIATFFGRINAFERNEKEITVIDFVNYLDLAEEAGENPSAKFESELLEGVQVSTVHSVKGLEFDTVFVTGMAARKFPQDNRKDVIEVPAELVAEILTEGDFHIQEERRLFYVACTRAKEKLHFIHSDYYNPSTAKSPRKNKRSVFIDEVIEKVELMQIEKESHTVESFLKPKVQAPKADVQAHKKHHNITHFSYTQLSTFDTCPRQYEYSEILKIPKPITGPQSFGASIHNTLLEFYSLVGQSKQASIFEEYKEDLSLKKLLSIYDEKWISHGYESKDHMKTLFERGKEILTKFHGHFKEGIPNIEFLEKAFKLKLGDYTLSGRIDRADKLPDGTLEIIDYKTGKSKSQKDVDEDAQLMIYAMAVKECFGETPGKLTLYYLDDDIKMSTEPDSEAVEQTKKDIIAIADEINSSDFTPKPSFKCQFCSYRKICDKAEL